MAELNKSLKDLVAVKRDILKSTMEHHLNLGFRTAGSDVFKILDDYIETRIKLALKEYKDSDPSDFDF